MLEHRNQQGAAVAVKLGVVYLGTVYGKPKYTLLDEADIEFARKHVLEAKLEIDRDGSGSCVYAVVKTTDEGTGDVVTQYFHDMLWRSHFRSIPHECIVSHKNGISVDNRLSNLELQEIDMATRLPTQKPLSQEEIDRRKNSGDLYRLALSRLPSFDHYPSTHRPPCMDANGMEVGDVFHTYPFYECRNPACCKIEGVAGEFEACSKCGVQRYCSTACLEQDSKRHLRSCKERSLPPELGASAFR